MDILKFEKSYFQDYWTDFHNYFTVGKLHNCGLFHAAFILIFSGMGLTQGTNFYYIESSSTA